MIFLFILISLLVLILWFMVSSRKSAEKVLAQAKKLEDDKKYKEACYVYAMAILGGCHSRDDYIKKIKNLWEEQGPFDYSDIEKRYKISDTKEGCGAAEHTCVMSIIEEAVTGKKRRFIVRKKSPAPK